MNQIKFYALGGLGDNGKNLYCIEINKKIIILDCGLQHPSGDLLGVDALVPDINYLVTRKDDVQGIFLSHAHDKNIGALPMLLLQMDKPVYGTDFTIAVVRDSLRENKINPEKFQLNVVEYKKIIKFEDFYIEFFATTHSVPLSAGIVIYTKDGAIVYTTDYNFNQDVPEIYRTDFQKIAKIADYGVLAFLNESKGSLNHEKSSGDDYLKKLIRHNFAKAKNRIIVAMYSTELSNIQMIINEAIRVNKKIAIIGRKAQRLLFIAEMMGYIKVPEDRLVNLKYLDSENNNELDDVIFLVTGERHEPFFMLQRMAKGFDRLVKLIESDTIMLLCPPLVGTEKIAAKTYDALAKLDVEMIKVQKYYFSRFHASVEDIKFMYTLLKPKYIIPINGEYRQLLLQANIAKEYGYQENEVFLLDNGEVISFTNGEKDRFHDMVENGTLMVDGTFETDLNDQVLKERELLAEDGFLLVIANINAKEKTMLNSPEIVSRGFMYMKENGDVVKEIEIIYQLETKRQFSQKTIDWQKYKDNLRYQIQRYLYNSTKRKPIVIPVIIDTSKEHTCDII
ncbi:MAG: ribonuclease J [Candidatus Izemoplasmatales bacterium]|nr:ribonuclease J [Candidatus Izemoplasmatales bacterium]